ncbi:MAG: AsmA family protein [Bacteroidia bacterium]|nr:AsmA family protein [Bacteroidia bacterium]
MKTLKKIIIILVVVLLVFIGIIIAIPFVYKDKLIAIAKEEINKMVAARIDFGEFDISIFSSFPDIRLGIKDIKAIGLNEFEKDTLIVLDKFYADVALLSVFSDNIKINEINLESPVIHVKILKGGKANWDIAPVSTDTTVTEQDTTAEDTSKFKLNLDKVIISNAALIYDDQDANMFADMKGLNFTLSGDMTSDFTSLITDLMINSTTFIYDGIKYLNKTELELHADMDADLVNYKFTLKDNSLRLNQLELGFIGWLAMPAEDIDMDMSFEAKKTDFRNILSLVPAVYAKDFEDVKTEGKLALNGFAKGTYGEKSLPAFNINLVVENAMFKYPDLPGSANNINIDLNVKNDDGIDDHTLINLKALHVDFANNPIDAKLFVQTPVSDPQIDAEIKGKIDMDNMKTIIPLEDMTVNGVITMDVKLKGKLSMLDNEQYEAFEALGQIAVDNMNYKSEDFPQGIAISHTDMTVSPQFFQLNTFDAKTGNSDIHLDGRIDNFLAYIFRNELIRGNFNFKSSKLDLDQFLGEDTETEETEPSVTEESTETTVYEIPKNIDFTLNAVINNMRYNKIDIQNVSGIINIKDGIAEMQKLSMNMLDGSLTLDGLYDTKDISKPGIDFDIAITGFDIPKTYNAFNTVQKLAPVAEHCNGKFSVGVKLNSLLQQNMEPELSTVQGEGRLQTKNITVTNSKTFDKIADELKMNNFKKLAFDNIDFLFEIKDGKVFVKPFITKFQKSQANIFGNMSIDQALDFTINLNIPRSEFGSEANDVLNNLVSEAGKQGVNIKPGDKVDVDVLIGGTVSDPKIRISLKDQAKNIVENIKEQVVEKVKEEFNKAKAEAIKKAEAEAARMLAEADAKSKMLLKEAESKAKQIKDAAQPAAAKVRSEAETNAKKVEDAANGKPKFMQDAAKASADKVRKEGDTQANKLINEANSNADKVVNEAKNPVPPFPHSPILLV